MTDSGMMYLRFRDGSIRGISSTPQDGTRQRIPDGATGITRDEYVTLKQQALLDIEATRDELRAGDRARQAADFGALSAAGLPDTLARRLSGYSGGDA